ncbi:hypothetical protein [Labilibaculum euxinus]
MKKQQIINMIGSPVLYLIFLELGKYRFNDNLGIVIFFGSFLSILWLFIGFVIPLNTVYFLSKTITSIEIENKVCKINTCKILWVKAKQVSISLDNITVRGNNFSIYESKPLKGMMITERVSGKRFHLVEVFYEDYEDILKCFNK